jgi:two-component system sensor histidine kinase KdpD
MSREDRKAALDTVHSEADRALLVLEGLLRLAEARSQPRPEMANVPLHAVLRRVVAAFQRHNPHRALEVSGDDPVFARANSLWVELALGNLLTNAEKYTPKDRAIEVASHQNGSRATISILDNGSGMRQESYHSLWEIYRRGPQQETTAAGAGIGLALCKELVEGMGGHVWAGPRQTGGSVFSLSLPAPWDMEVPDRLATRMPSA